MNNSKLESLLRLDRKDIPADGGSAYNRLIFARSPYLLQHAENPVDWREWGEDAFAEARKKDLPLFISIGYATCHWCHVMAEESFSDSEVAALLNKFFIPVKVDREERPDIDEFYMTAARALTGGGGWPLNVFIDYDRRPFFSITYLPKLPRHRSPGLIDLLGNISSIWREKRVLLTSNSEEIFRSISALSAYAVPTGRQLDAMAAEALNHLEDMYDKEHGGFGVAVKFPMPMYLLFLLSRDGSRFPKAHSMAVRTLEVIMNGGIHDQLGGGFHRYAVDQKWRIPHFEKMLYDQALLIIAYCKAFASTNEQRFLETAIKTARFACKELLEPGCGFSAGLDADSEGEEGIFYTWSLAELQSILGTVGTVALEYWGADSQGDLDGRCILHQAFDAEDLAAARKISSTELLDTVSAAAGKLLHARAAREKPLRDTKIIVSWNALMITALVKLYSVSGDREWLETAENSARFMLSCLVNSDGRLVRNWLGTPSAVPAFAEDYAAFTTALIELAACGQDPVWMEKLIFFGNELARLFVNDSGEVAFCGVDAEKMPLEIPAVQDGVLPSTVALAAVTFIRLGRLQQNSSLLETGRRIIERYRGTTEKNPAACLSLIMAEEELCATK